MGIKLYKEPQLEKPDLIACWPGIGNIGLIAVDTLRAQVGADELGEIEASDFFYPNKVIIRKSILEDMQFPGNRFYYKRLAKKDVIFFIGEEQPSDTGRVYAEGTKAYQMASMVLDVADKFQCRRIYTSGAAVSLTHHAVESRVWAVASARHLLEEMRHYNKVVSMTELEGKGDQGTITGLNGLLLGMARSRGHEAVCLMGEMPDYLSGAPFPFPKASKSVMDVFAKILDIEMDYHAIDEMIARIDEVIEGMYDKFPADIKERVEQRKSPAQPKPEEITEEDTTWLKDHIDELFKKTDSGNEELS